MVEGGRGLCCHGNKAHVYFLGGAGFTETNRPQDYFNIELTRDTSFTVQGLKPYTTFAFHVRAFNSKGGSPASKVVYATTEESGKSSLNA